MLCLCFLDLATIAVAFVALLSAQLPFLPYMNLVRILSHVLAKIFIAELSQGQAAVMQQSTLSVRHG